MCIFPGIEVAFPDKSSGKAQEIQDFLQKLKRNAALKHLDILLAETLYFVIKLVTRR